ncbi:secretin N-terminal domain-containing protein [Thermodesulfobacteriota bacterium]
MAGIKQNITRLLLLLWCLLLLFGIFCNIALAKDVAVIRVKYRWARELAPIVQSMLSPDGSVTVSERVNSLVIVDNPDAIQRVRAYLDQFDKPPEQVRIRVRFHEQRTGEAGSISARGRVSGDDWHAATGGRRKDGADISVEEGRRQRTNFSEHAVIATTGQAAYIVAGKEIPYHERWPDLSRRYGRGVNTVIFQVVETGFDVTPIISDENVLLKIVPRMAYDDDTDAVVRFYGAQTEVRVPYGRWVEIGGVGDQQNEVITEILSRGRNDQTTSMSMSIMAEKL